MDIDPGVLYVVSIPCQVCVHAPFNAFSEFAVGPVINTLVFWFKGRILFLFFNKVIDSKTAFSASFLNVGVPNK